MAMETRVECALYKEERDVVREEITKIAECDMEKFGALDNSYKTIAIQGDKMVATDSQTGRRQDKRKF